LQQQKTITVQGQKGQSLTFTGKLLACAEALNHDDSIRRRFCVYQSEQVFVAERIDSPGTLDARYWASRCSDEQQLYDFFGNEPLANYLYGLLTIEVPGLRRGSQAALSAEMAQQR